MVCAAQGCIHSTGPDTQLRDQAAAALSSPPPPSPAARLPSLGLRLNSLPLPLPLQEQAIAELWLEALQVSQVASSLLLRCGRCRSPHRRRCRRRRSCAAWPGALLVAAHSTRRCDGRELDEVEANLRYWHRREQRGGQFFHNLLRRVSPACATAGELGLPCEASAARLPSTPSGAVGSRPCMQSAQGTLSHAMLPTLLLHRASAPAPCRAGPAALPRPAGHAAAHQPPGRGRAGRGGCVPLRMHNCLRSCSMCKACHMQAEHCCG